MITRQLAEYVRFVVGMLRNAGPYVLLELVMPGGTLLALLLFYYRRPSTLAVIRRGAQRIMRWLVDVRSDVVLALHPRVTISVCRASSRNPAA